MLDTKIIREFNGNVIEKVLFLEKLKEYTDKGYNVYIGTDSQVVKKKVKLVTAICFNKSGTSGKIYFIREKLERSKYPNLRTRMLLEAYRSIELAMELDELISTNLEIHLDVGDTIRSKTSLYESELQALVKGQGYDCEIKPHSWASSAVADKVVKRGLKVS